MNDNQEQKADVKICCYFKGRKELKQAEKQWEVGTGSSLLIATTI